MGTPNAHFNFNCGTRVRGKSGRFRGLKSRVAHVCAPAVPSRSGRRIGHGRIARAMIRHRFRIARARAADQPARDRFGDAALLHIGHRIADNHGHRAGGQRFVDFFGRHQFHGGKRRRPRARGRMLVAGNALLLEDAVSDFCAGGCTRSGSPEQSTQEDSAIQTVQRHRSPALPTRTLQARRFPDSAPFAIPRGLRFYFAENARSTFPGIPPPTFA